MDKIFFNFLFSVIAFVSIISFTISQGALCIMDPEQWFAGFVSFTGLVTAGWYFLRR